MAFRIAWFKVYHPLAFYAAYFSIRAKAFDLRIMTGDLKTQMTEFNRIKALDRGASPKDDDLFFCTGRRRRPASRSVRRVYHSGYRAGSFQHAIIEVNFTCSHECFKICKGTLKVGWSARDTSK